MDFRRVDLCVDLWSPNLDITERIKAVRGKLSQEEFAQLLGVHKNSVGRYERGDSTPGMDFAEKVCFVYGVSPEWFLLGTGPMKLDSAFHEDVAVLGPLVAGSGVTSVPAISLGLSAGHGNFIYIEENEVRKTFAFSTAFLQKKGNPSQMVVMTVSGDSMSPEIRNGDLVLIDQSQTRLLPGKIYAVAVENFIYLKVVDTLPGTLVLSSFNKEYPPLNVDMRGQMEDMVRILGRAVWWCREL